MGSKKQQYAQSILAVGPCQCDDALFPNLQTRVFCPQQNRDVGKPEQFLCKRHANYRVIQFQLAKDRELNPSLKSQYRLTIEDVIKCEGVGTEIHRIIVARGETVPDNCKCVARIRAMNERGVQWCKDNRKTIVRWLEEAAQKHNVPSYVLARKLKALPVWRACVMLQVIWPAIREAKMAQK